MADQIRHGLAQRVLRRLEQGRWIGTGFYARGRVTRVNDVIVRLRGRPARPAGPVLHGLYLVVLPAWGEPAAVIPLSWQAIAGARSELARPREQLAHRAARRGIRCPRYLLLALLWAVAGGCGLVGRLLH